jgi:hypothetical protein
MVFTVVIITCLFFSTLESITFLVLASLNCWIANYKNKSRLIFGMALSYIQIIYVLAVMYFKSKICSTKIPVFKDKRKMEEYIGFWKTFGMEPKANSIIIDKAHDHFEFKFGFYESCIPDYVFLSVFFFYVYY